MTRADELDELLADARALLDETLEAGCPPPDVLDVLQRARMLSATPDGDVEPSVAELELVLDLVPELDPELAPELERSCQPDLELAELNADARLLLDGLLERRGTARRTRWRRRPRALGVAAAAVVLLGLAGAAFASKKWQELEAIAESERFAATAIAELDRAWQAETERVLSPAPMVLTWTVPLAVPQPQPASESDQGTAETAARTTATPTPTAKPDTAARLAELDAQAYALLRAGHHEQAARQFRVIVKIGGHSEYAELAFGELFALARRDSPTDELGELWSAYIERFPRGRYADAARAGLCRRTPEPDKPACWTDYLLEHPRGAARSEALRESQNH